MTRDEQRVYQRGYNAAVRQHWPPHKPPTPPDPLIAELVTAATKLRDAYDNMIAMGDDEMEKQFGPSIDALDAAMSRVTLWLTETESGATP